MCYELNETHFDVFETCCNRIIDWLNLNDWGINYAFNPEDGDNARAI